MADESVMETTKFQFPVASIKKPQEYLPEVQLPIRMTLDDIKQDMYSYAKKFPKEIIPHVNEAKEINDIIHNYQRLKPSTQTSHKPGDPESKKLFDLEAQKVNTALSQATPTLTEEIIQTA